MAKVTIVLTDTEDGQVSMKMTCDPPLSNDTGTPAQALGVDLLEYATASCEDAPKCEGCDAPATTIDNPEDCIPLCDKCAAALPVDEEPPHGDD